MILAPSESCCPLTRPALVIAVPAAIVTGLIASSPLVGFAFFVLIATVGGTWVRDRPAIFPFILAYQWVAVTVGYFYSLITGIYPSPYATGDIERTLWLALCGLLLLAFGIRLVCSVKIGLHQDSEPLAESQIGDLPRLFWVVLAVYAIDYFYVLNTRAYSSAGQILARVLDFRQVLLLTLWWEVLRRREHFRYLWISLAWVFVPLLGSYFSDFKGPLVLLLIVSLSVFKPWEREAWRFSKRQVFTGLGVAVALVFVALVWQAGVKRETRKAYDANTVRRDPLERIGLFVSSAEANLPVVFEDTQSVIEGLVERISYITFFSRALDHVPRIQPHTNGELFGVAMTNAFMPRFLFPDKPELPSDSVYTRRFTGIAVTEDATSISIGYMAEFYVDWGVTGMMLMIFAYGCWIGLAYRIMVQFVRVPVFVNPVLVTVLMAVYQFEHQFIKTFASLNIAVIVILAMVFVLGRPLTKFFDVTPVGDEEEQGACDGDVSYETGV